MKILIDTHVFLWAISQPSWLSAKARDILGAGVSPYLSVVSQWEIAIKHQAGKLDFENPEEFIPRHMEALKVMNLGVKPAHVLKTFSLAPHHKDPFDRLLIAQALVEGCAMMTTNTNIVRYPVNIIW